MDNCFDKGEELKMLCLLIMQHGEKLLKYGSRRKLIMDNSFDKEEELKRLGLLINNLLVTCEEGELLESPEIWVLQRFLSFLHSNKSIISSVTMKSIGIGLEKIIIAVGLDQSDVHEMLNEIDLIGGDGEETVGEKK